MRANNYDLGIYDSLITVYSSCTLAYKQLRKKIKYTRFRSVIGALFLTTNMFTSFDAKIRWTQTILFTIPRFQHV